MSIADLLNELGEAVASAKAKADVVSGLRAELASYTASKQAEIDEAVTDYTDAKTAADRLQGQARDVIGQILPTPDARFRVSQ
jgi:hypothetical protein